MVRENIRIRQNVDGLNNYIDLKNVKGYTINKLKRGQVVLHIKYKNSSTCDVITLNYGEEFDSDAHTTIF